VKIIESYTYLGPNRRAKVCLIENLVELSPAEQQLFLDNAEDYRSKVLFKLRSNGIQVHTEALSSGHSDESALEAFAGLYAGSALAVQQATGHKVKFMGITGDTDPNRIRSMFEFEQSDVGDHADLLVHRLLAETMPELDWHVPDWDNHDPDKPFDFYRSFAEFTALAGKFILPQDTQAIIDAATLRDIPCVKLERDPYESPESEWRVRKNGLLKLGHSIHNHVVDGTFCVDKGFRFFPLLRDRLQLLKFLSDHNAPITPLSREHPVCLTYKHAVRCAHTLGFPVVVKPRLRSPGKYSSHDVSDENELRTAVEKVRGVGNQFIVEKQFAGANYRAIVANGELMGVVREGSEQDLGGDIHPELMQLILRLAGLVDVGLSVIEILTEDITLSLQKTGCTIVDMDIGPQLDSFLSPGSALHKRSIEAFLSWLYPEGSISRIPLVSITGTNGKTTTSRMIDMIVRAAGYHSGLANSDGVYQNGELFEAGILSGLGGHLRVLESKEIDMGILETSRGGIVSNGFMYDWCNVAVCLNVTMDHIGESGIDSIEEMAVLKRSIVETAKDGAVLFADDENCLAMVPFLSCPKICLVSITSDIDQLRKYSRDASCFALVEKVRETNWMVLYDGETRTPVVSIDEVPSTYGGKARHNISNALHALAASYLMGVDFRALSAGLKNFENSFESSPGRLTFYDEHPFTVLLDYAHNADSFIKLCDFVDQIDVEGRKILMFQARAGYGEEFIRQLVAATAGHFDHYVCRCHPEFPGPDAEFSATLMKDILLEHGVSDHQVTTSTDPVLSVDITLEMGAEGDLLVLCPGVSTRKETWDQIIAFKKPM